MYVDTYTLLYINICGTMYQCFCLYVSSFHCFFGCPLPVLEFSIIRSAAQVILCLTYVYSWLCEISFDLQAKFLSAEADLEIFIDTFAMFPTPSHGYKEKLKPIKKKLTCLFSVHFCLALFRLVDPFMCESFVASTQECTIEFSISGFFSILT